MPRYSDLEFHSEIIIEIIILRREASCPKEYFQSKLVYRPPDWFRGLTRWVGLRLDGNHGHTTPLSPSRSMERSRIFKETYHIFDPDGLLSTEWGFLSNGSTLHPPRLLLLLFPRLNLRTIGGRYHFTPGSSRNLRLNGLLIRRMDTPDGLSLDYTFPSTWDRGVRYIRIPLRNPNKNL